jgi:hypothetical protein
MVKKNKNKKPQTGRFKRGGKTLDGKRREETANKQTGQDKRRKTRNHRIIA